MFVHAVVGWTAVIIGCIASKEFTSISHVEHLIIMFALTSRPIFIITTPAFCLDVLSLSFATSAIQWTSTDNINSILSFKSRKCEVYARMSSSLAQVCEWNWYAYEGTTDQLESVRSWQLAWSWTVVNSWHCFVHAKRTPKNILFFYPRLWNHCSCTYHMLF